MKIDFEDGSFVLFEESTGKMQIILCAKKDKKTTIMAASLFEADQIKQIITFLEKWIKKV